MNLFKEDPPSTPQCDICGTRTLVRIYTVEEVAGAPNRPLCLSCAQRALSKFLIKSLDEFIERLN